jgi:hypothetical protein
MLMRIHIWKYPASTLLFIAEMATETKGLHAYYNNKMEQSFNTDADEDVWKLGPWYIADITATLRKFFPASSKVIIKPCLVVHTHNPILRQEDVSSKPSRDE